MAQRDLDFDPSVTNDVAQDPDNTANAIAQVAGKVAETAAASQVVVNTAKAHAAYKGLDAQYREQFADNPNSPEAQQWLSDQRQSVNEDLGQNISTLYMNEWNTATSKLADSSDIQNEAWGVHQNYRNTVNNFNTARAQYLDGANKDGQAFGAGGGEDGSAILNFGVSQKLLTDAAAQHLGQTKAQELTAGYSADYAKSFVSGVAENNPEAAARLLQDPNIASHFSTQDRGDMIAQIDKTTRQQELLKSFTATQGNDGLQDIINDNSQSYLQKRLTIDKMDMAGTITPQAAAQARRVIKSSEAVDTVTDSSAMSDIITQANDLDANAKSSPSDYLIGINDIQHSILQNQADGKITQQDATKLNNMVRNMTSKRIADATTSVGNDMGNATQSFNQLPPEYRGVATRQLFNLSYGKNFNTTQYQNAANGITASINAQRRQQANAVVNATTQSDDDLLKSYNYSRADVTATAKAHGISEASVINSLRAKHINTNKGKAPEPAKPVNISRSDDTEADENAPSVAPEGDGND